MCSQKAADPVLFVKDMVMSGICFNKTDPTEHRIEKRSETPSRHPLSSARL